MSLFFSSLSSLGLYQAYVKTVSWLLSLFHYTLLNVSFYVLFILCSAVFSPKLILSFEVALCKGLTVGVIWFAYSVITYHKIPGIVGDANECNIYRRKVENETKVTRLLSAVRSRCLNATYSLWSRKTKVPISSWHLLVSVFIQLILYSGENSLSPHFCFSIVLWGLKYKTHLEGMLKKKGREGTLEHKVVLLIYFNSTAWQTYGTALRFCRCWIFHPQNKA